VAAVGFARYAQASFQHFPLADPHGYCGILLVFRPALVGDLYVELSDLVRSSRLIDNVDFYLHIGEVKQAGHVFPIF
jgi:hypothetical protein